MCDQSILETLQYGNFELRICYDDNPMDPREWDNLGEMYCWHNRYRLGDKNPYTIEEFDEMLPLFPVALPLYMYDHSGITIRTYPFSCPWDSGQIGWIVASADKIREEYNRTRITKNLIDKVKRVLVSEVKVYDAFVSGEVYGYEVFDTRNNEWLDNCWGYYGSDGYDQAKEDGRYFIKMEVSTRLGKFTSGE